jgi:hypothetical protein
MIQARIYQGCVEVQEPIPEEWEGQLVKILPMTPDDPLPDLEERLAALQAMGPMEFEPGERELITGALVELDRLSKAAMQTAAGRQP